MTNEPESQDSEAAREPTPAPAVPLKSDQETDPPASAAASTTSPDQTQDLDGSQPTAGLRSWGPYKRWHWYREMAKDRDHSFWRDRDPEENAPTRLPSDEHLEVAAVWVTELYTPSTVGGLLDGIESLDWEYGRSRDDSLAKWMSDVRHGRTAGWTSLGLVSSPGDRHFMAERIAQLPTGAQAALPVLMSLTPSVTALVTCFILSDDAARLLDGPLRADYSTYSTRDTRFRRRHALRYILWNGPVHMGSRIHHPDMQRREAVASALDDLDERCRSWVAKSLPGAFASGLRGGLFPTVMLFLTEKCQPVTDESRATPSFEGADLDRAYDAWRSDEWPASRMLLPHNWRKEELRLRFACRRKDAFPKDAGYSEPLSNWTIAQRADDLLRGFSTRWALSCLLEGYSQRLSQLRDLTAAGNRGLPVVGRQAG